MLRKIKSVTSNLLVAQYKIIQKCRKFYSRFAEELQRGKDRSKVKKLNVAVSVQLSSNKPLMKFDQLTTKMC